MRHLTIQEMADLRSDLMDMTWDDCPLPVAPMWILAMRLSLGVHASEPESQAPDHPADETSNNDSGGFV